MKRNNIFLTDKERFLKPHKIDRAKLELCAKRATDKLLELYKRKGFGYPGTCSKDFEYTLTDVTNWESGMYTGSYWLAYQLTGNEKFKNIALSHLPSYEDNVNRAVNINDHDVGFMYSPSCVAAYKLTGDIHAREVALRAAKYFYDNSYSQKGKFIIRVFKARHEPWGCRTMMDSLMNAPFLFWAANESGNEDYYKAALDHNMTTENLLIREDGSSFHHYQFEVGSEQPLNGVNFQGHKDDSCWSRGLSWGVYGFPIAYSYTKNEKLKNVHHDIAYYLLNNLPKDNVPYWDFDFSDAEPSYKDVSAALISACGLHEMARQLDDGCEDKAIFMNAAAMMLESVIDNYTGDIGKDYDGLVHHVTHAVPFDQGFEECAVYGDYFYLEALMRFLNPDFKMYW